MVDGKTINIVGYHTWPFGMSRETRGKGKDIEAESTAALGGHYYRTYETEYFIKNTVNNPKFADEKYWIITGDTNCRSSLDDAFLGYGPKSPRYGSNNYVLDHSGCKDIIKTYNSPDQRDVLMSSTQKQARIDIMYGSDEPRYTCRDSKGRIHRRTLQRKDEVLRQVFGSPPSNRRFQVEIIV